MPRASPKSLPRAGCPCCDSHSMAAASNRVRAHGPCLLALGWPRIVSLQTDKRSVAKAKEPCLTVPDWAVLETRQSCQTGSRSS